MSVHLGTEYDTDAVAYIYIPWRTKPTDTVAWHVDHFLDRCNNIPSRTLEGRPKGEAAKTLALNKAIKELQLDVAPNWDWVSIPGGGDGCGVNQGYDKWPSTVSKEHGKVWCPRLVVVNQKQIRTPTDQATHPSQKHWMHVVAMGALRMLVTCAMWFRGGRRERK